MRGYFPFTRKRANSDNTQSKDLTFNPYSMLPHTFPQYAAVPTSPMDMYPLYPWPYPSPPYWPSELDRSTPETKETLVNKLLSPAAKLRELRVLYDVRFRPDKSYLSSNPPTKLSREVLSSFATSPPVPKMRLVSRLLPWIIVVKNPTGVTIADILEAVYTTLQQPLTEGEWWIALGAERARTLSAYKHNCSDAPGTTHKRRLEEGVKRVDWLGGKTFITGISRSAQDDPFLSMRIPNKEVKEAWVLQLGSF